MSRTLSLGRLFATSTIQAQGAPIVDRGVTNEAEGQLRGGRCLVVRPPFTRHRPVRALVLGVWLKPKLPAGPPVGPEVGR